MSLCCEKCQYVTSLHMDDCPRRLNLCALPSLTHKHIRRASDLKHEQNPSHANQKHAPGVFGQIAKWLSKLDCTGCRRLSATHCNYFSVCLPWWHLNDNV